MTWVVDVDIKGFFDNVNHTKLMRLVWNMGIHDKQILVVIRKMLKAPIQMPNGALLFPNKGTPQGGILSPLLANIYLHELDVWLTSQWERMPTKREYKEPPGRNGIGHIAVYISVASPAEPFYVPIHLWLRQFFTYFQCHCYQPPFLFRVWWVALSSIHSKVQLSRRQWKTETQPA